MAGRVRIGTSGWLYPPWRGVFYPPKLPHRRELEYLSSKVNSVEINGSFYSLQRPASYQSWREQTPDGFEFAVKGGRFITHMKRLRDIDAPLANFFASGVLALGEKLGPFLWQLPPSLPFDADQLAAFFAMLPRTTTAAAELATRHDERLEGRALTVARTHAPLRHALEVRHQSFTDPAFLDVLREHGIGLVIADAAAAWPYLEHVTADFAYVRLHGSTELYTSGYTDDALDRLAARIRRWTADGLDAYAYFDNDAKVKAPADAIALGARLELAWPPA
ncbi:DUF72 domain-containing protein [Actinophytocola xanthii]|uniref:DUF72 domain-containing protein n=1 Tax=Actinophytocola xanthii TaxID=1912961 RepID=A0A1Q8CUJ1_9PSEU|nr:DUF72 domain-containing protein [Actinophytocola xanthii]OLF18006.1 hypothetical protein BU204_08510 [Actinophytocola xanthii]